MTQANPSTTSRRQFLAAAIATPIAVAAGGPTAALASTSTVMPGLAAAWFALDARLRELDDFVDRTDATAIPFAEVDRLLEDLCDRRNEIEADLGEAVATTPADAIAHLEVARDDMVRFTFCGVAYSDHGDGGDHLVLSAIDNALRVLRHLVEGGAT